MNIFFRISGLLLALIFISCGSDKKINFDEKDWFVFQAESTTGPSVIGMSEWLDKPAGKHGHLQIKDDRFVFEDGTPVKFWGVNIASNRPYADSAKADKWAEFLAKHGINAVRFHKFSSHGLKKNISTGLKPEKFKKLDYFHSRLKEEGIYYGWSHIYGHKPKPGDKDKIIAYEEIKNLTFPWSHLNGATSGLVNFAPDLQKLNIRLTVNMLNHHNPYTGLKYANDPALAYIELQNEDNIFWGAIERSLNQSPTYRKMLNRQFSSWLKNKYGSQESLEEAWGTENIQEGQSLAKENIYPQPNHSLFESEYKKALKEDREISQHILDKMRFLYEKQVEFYDRFVQAIRGTGYEGAIVASCWQAGSGPAHYYNLHADYRTGFIDRHNYFGGSTGHDLDTGKVNNQAMVNNPGSGLLSTGMQQVIDRPFAISEWMSKIPNEWNAESAPLIAIYGMGLQGWDASFNYASNNPFITGTIQAPNHGIYNAESPLQIGLYPALARMVYQQGVKEGKVISERNVHIPSLKKGKQGFKEKVEQDYDNKRFKSFVPQEALAAGKVVVDFTERFKPSKKPDLKPYINNKTITSNTGQLKWNYNGKGYFTANTPSFKAVVGFAENKRHDLGRVQLTTRNPFSVVMINSLEKGKSISDSRRLLITAVARAKNTGMKYNEDHTRVVKTGGPPILMEPVVFDLNLEREGNPKIHILDHDGKRTGKTLNVDNGQFTLDGRKTKTIYYEVVYE